MNLWLRGIGQFPAIAVHEVFDQARDVLPAIPQWRQVDHRHIQAIIKVLAEFAFQNCQLEIAMGRCDDANIHRDRFFPAEPLKCFLLENPKQLGLEMNTHVANLIQEHRAMVSLFKAADPPGLGVGESAGFVPEQLAFQELLGNGRAIDNDKRVIVPCTVPMQGGGDELLAGAGLSRMRTATDLAARRPICLYMACIRELLPIIASGSAKGTASFGPSKWKRVSSTACSINAINAFQSMRPLMIES